VKETGTEERGWDNYVKVKERKEGRGRGITNKKGLEKNKRKMRCT
jgi:hypothetical protein